MLGGNGRDNLFLAKMIVENTEWVGIEKLPAFNPFMFEIARHTRGQVISYVSAANNISVKRIKAIENGDVEPIKSEVERLSYWYDFPIPFFEQWWDTQLDISGPWGKNVPIDYMKYKVFRDLNPKFARMKIYFPEPVKEQAKVIQFPKNL